MLATPGHDGTLVLPPPFRGSSDLLRDWEDDARTLRHDSDRVTLWTPAPGAIVALPQHHEPDYAYPLLLWLPDESQTEAEAAVWLERISRRNYVALGLRPALFSGGGRGSAFDRLNYVVRRVESEVQIHSQRRYLAGVGHSGGLAIDWLLERPQSFAGAIAIDAENRPTFAARVPRDRLVGRRLLWARTSTTESVEPSPASLAAMQALGVEVDRWRPDVPGDLLEQLGRFIDGWILSAVPSTISA
jgi:phospholipase/carboxylesterase